MRPATARINGGACSEPPACSGTGIGGGVCETRAASSRGGGGGVTFLGASSLDSSPADPLPHMSCSTVASVDVLEALFRVTDREAERVAAAWQAEIKL